MDHPNCPRCSRAPSHSATATRANTTWHRVFCAYCHFGAGDEDEAKAWEKWRGMCKGWSK